MKRHVFLVAVLASQLASAVTVTNSTFEDNSATYVDLPGADRMSAVAAPGWTIYLNSPDWFWGDGPAGLWETPYGDHFAIGAATGTTGSAYREGIRQTVSGFTVGDMYEIGFSHTNGLFFNPGSPGFYEGAGNAGGWQVLVDGTSIGLAASTNDNSAPALNWTPNWENSSVVFTATAASHEIQFVAYKPDGLGQDPTFQFLDHVDVQRIPEPSAMLLALAGALTMLRRRRM
mgnify:CR=1 FL=1